MKTVLFLVGPTACGKTAYAIEAARAFSGEIVNADSMQIYEQMEIGSAKPTCEERKQAVFHLVDCVDPRTPFSVAEYRPLAQRAISEIGERNKLPIVSGGTGLYVNSLLYQMDFGRTQRQDDVRSRLESEAEEEGTDALYARLQALDPEEAKRIENGNLRKILRALELHELTGEGLRDFQQSFQPVTEYRSVLIGLTRPREELVERIRLRTEAMFDAGLVEEVRQLMEAGVTENALAMKAIGYKEVIRYLSGDYDLAACKELVFIHTRQYAKRQMTWFKRLPGIRWIDLSQAPHVADAPLNFKELLQENG